ncbi:hypothetical protein J31TS4_40300 [Paenibacillus sp. J31TS4]|nr:hypothetical protein [Paenibacillus sp. J31TS4]GIP40750.1 hypothetical protein J31TS4_40300 [Paenibacillus sp. J31TS4]
MTIWLAAILGILLVRLVWHAKKTYDRSGTDREEQIRSKLEELRKKRDE